MYVSIDTFYFIRYPAQLVARISLNSLTIDKYDNLVIDASASYDPEDLGLTYYYAWTCPGKVSCSSKNSSTLTLTSIER
jgi:hypothetical protein